MIVIYDGQCRFCRACLTWLERKLEVSALAYQETDLEKYHLSIEQCSQEVFVIDEGVVSSGAKAVATLLKARGNRALGVSLTLSGKLGDWAYRWVAGHRNSWLVRGVTVFLERVNKRSL